MASIRLKRTNEDGCKVYEIRAAHKRGQGQKSMQWIAPKGWSQKSIDRELNKIAAELDRQVKAGEILTRAEQKEREKAAAAALAKIQTVKRYAEEVYLPAKAEECKGNTQYFYEQFLRNFIYPAIGDIKITDVTPTDIEKIKLHAQQKGYKYATMNGLYKTMSQLFKMAYKHDVIDRNPVDKVDPPKRRKDENKEAKETFTPDELKQIKELLSNEGLQWQTLFNILIDSGIRRGEACALKWKNIDMKTGKVLIDSNICTTSNGEWYETTTKSGKSRYAFISDRAISMLQQLKVKHSKAGYISPYVFLKRGTAEPLRPDSVTDFGRKFEKKYSIEKRCNPHNFRHTWATLAIENGATPADVSKGLGHADITTTMDIYVHPDDAAAERASKYFFKAMGY